MVVVKNFDCIYNLRTRYLVIETNEPPESTLVIASVSASYMYVYYEAGSSPAKLLATSLTQLVQEIAMPGLDHIYNQRRK